jgi:hypothetical protein
VWNSGGSAYDHTSRGIADLIEHAVVRLNLQPGERILSLATGPGWLPRSGHDSGAAQLVDEQRRWQLRAHTLT